MRQAIYTGLLFIIVPAVGIKFTDMDLNALNLQKILVPPDDINLIGTDELGRDYLTRVIYGVRVSLLVGVLTMIASVAIGIMYLGSIVELGTSEEVFRNLIHPDTKALISAISIADPELSRQRRRIPIEGELLSTKNAPRGCRFCTRCLYPADRFREDHPEIREITPGHYARCHIL